jgi:hypothetical protein
METQNEIMRKAGCIPAAEAATACGYTQISTIHRMIARGRVKGTRVGRAWYVNVKSLLNAFKDAEPIRARIAALGVPLLDAPAPAAKRRRGAA